MIEADESGFIVLIVDVMNSRGHLKSLVTGTSLILSTSISLTRQYPSINMQATQHTVQAGK